MNLERGRRIVFAFHSSFLPFPFPISLLPFSSSIIFPFSTMTPLPLRWAPLLLLLLLSLMFTSARAASLDPSTSPSTPGKPPPSTTIPYAEGGDIENVIADDKPDGKTHPTHSVMQKSNETLDSVVVAAGNSTNMTDREQRRFLDEGTVYVLNSDGTPISPNTEIESEAFDVQESDGGESNEWTDSMGVRKCCELNQFFSLLTQQCQDVEGDTGIDAAVLGLAGSSDANRSLHYNTGLLQQCPGSGMLPTISETNHRSHSIASEGHLIDHVTQQHYDHNHYCVELAAHGGDELGSAILVAAWCQMWSSQVLARKCCGLNQYFDHAHGDCRQNDINFTDHEVLVRNFFRTDPLVDSIQINPGRLRCDGGTPKIVEPADAFLDSNGQLCEFHTGHCYPPELYCLENLWAEGDIFLTPVASVCPLDSFHKCCPRNEILTETGCVPGEHISARMIQLLEIMEPQYGFPTENGGELCVQEWITPDDEDLRWWISKTGYLSVDTRMDSRDTMRYCVDDYLDPGEAIHTVAVMCHSELEQLVHVALTSQFREKGTLGKCCPHRHYLNMVSMACVPDDKGLVLEREPQMQALNVTELTYTSFPECTSPEGFHHYSLDPFGGDDYAVLSTDYIVEIVSTDGRCVLSRRPYENDAYCLEYMVNGSTVIPSILVCPKRWDGADVHTEKFGLTAVLLGLSCMALLATAFSLISTRVRRGLVTVKKVNTLAGRILLSYVMSYLVGFVLLAVNMRVEVTQDNPECHIMAGLLIFFLLAAFQWNTSICLESLLLTLHVSVSEGRRYLLHSAWAWGVPGLVTALALTLDYYRQSLSCGVITPKIGLYKCFFSDRNAKLVYLYVPMLISLLANCFLLTAARYVRSAKLRRLEQGPGRNRNTDCEGTEIQQQGGKKKNSNRNKTNGTQANNGQANGTAPHSSGLRTHQTRNLWSESVKLVIWSGGTWLLEVMGFVMAQYIVKPSESWYDYLWYLPSSINALRGVGIFFILVITPENRLKLSRWLTKMGLLSLAKNIRSSDGTRSTAHQRSSIVGSRTDSSEVRTGRGRRNMSIATVITQLSSFRSSSQSNNSLPDSNGVGRRTAHPNLGSSVSQIDIRRGSSSSQSSEFEGFELDTEVGPPVGAAGGRRKSSLANAGPALPSVNEEEAVDDLSILHSVSNDTTGSSSDA